MAGIKGRSGRRARSADEKRLHVIDKAWDIVNQILNDPAILLRDKATYAIDIVKKSIPQSPLIDQSKHFTIVHYGQEADASPRSRLQLKDTRVAT